MQACFELGHSVERLQSQHPIIETTIALKRKAGNYRRQIPPSGKSEYLPQCHIRAATWRVILNVRFFSRRPFLAIMCIRDVSRKTGST